MLMRFVATLVLVAFPLAYFGWRLTEFRSQVVRIACLALAAVVLLLQFPTSGGTWTELRRAMLIVNTSVVALLVVRFVSDGRRPDRIAGTTWLGLTAVSALLVYLNFFQLHGPRVIFFHPHDGAHYYLGSKYAPELGYAGIYAAMLRAEADDRDGKIASREARDLAEDRLVPVDTLASLGARVKDRFGPARWEEFREDVRFFRDILAHNYPKVLADHGYNPSPVWTLIGGSVANVTTASDATFRRLSLLDVAILVAAGLVVGATLGVETLCLTIVYFCVSFGAELGWVGGGFLRQMWFGAVIAFAVCLARGRHAMAGAFLAVATLLRLFPAFFAIGIAARAVADWAESRKIAPAHRRFFAAFAITAGVLFLASGIYPGFDQWHGFFDNTARHAGRVGFNAIGLSQSSILLFGETPSDSAPVWLEQLRDWREATSRAHLLTFLSAVALVLFAARRLDDLRAAALGAPLLLCGLNLAGYYYTLVVVVVLAFRDRADKLAWLFGAELVIHALHLFQPEQRMLHLYKGLVLLYALVAVYLPDRAETKPRPAPAT
jgi:hypothetical protein